MQRPIKSARLPVFVFLNNTASSGTLLLQPSPPHPARKTPSPVLRAANGSQLLLKRAAELCIHRRREQAYT